MSAQSRTEENSQGRIQGRSGASQGTMSRVAFETQKSQDYSVVQELKIHWVDEQDLDPNLARSSISSEEDATICSAVDDCCYVRSRRSGQHQDIWSHDEILVSLRALPGGEEIVALLEAGDFDAVAKHNNASRTGMLCTAWLNKSQLLEKLIFKHPKSIDVTDTAGRTPLHLACCASAEATCKLLISHHAPVNAWDRHHRVMPLHCAASVGNLPCLRHLLQAGADINAGITCHSALHYAVQSDAVDCVQELLNRGACPNTPQVFTETPLHVAAALGSGACVKLLLDHGAGVKVQYGPGKVTPLHLAAEDGNAECARLLLDASAEINVTNNRQQTPLHLAALSQSTETLELLLKRGADPNCEDADGRTPLHGAIVKVSRSCECVKLLLEWGAAVNKADAFGYSPVHIAALNEFSSCVYLLLTYGGDVTAKTKGGASALSFIVRRTPDIIPRFVANLNASVKLHDHEIGDVDCELKLDFRILVPSVEQGESTLLLTFIEVGQREILKHPLCETFLFLKWRRIRKFFIFSLFFHTLFVLLFSTYVIQMFQKDCNGISTGNSTDSNSNLKNESKANLISTEIHVIKFVLISLNLILLLKEVFQICHGWYGYVHYWENWLQWLIIISTLLCLYPFGWNTSNFNHICNTTPRWHDWQHHVAAISIFLAWLELMMLVGRFPMFGLYVQMFTTVAINFGKFLLAYSCLLIAFSLSFGVLFPNRTEFQDIKLALIKTVIMMSGELEFVDIFHSKDEKILYPYTAHLIFLAFVLLITVILTNLLVGLAVSDIQGLQQSAGLDRLVRQAELVARLESMLFSRLLFCLPRKLLSVCQRSALLLTSSYHWALFLRPNDPRENRVPRDLINNAFRLVAETPRNRMRHGSMTRSRKNTNDANIRSYQMSTKHGGYCPSNDMKKADIDEKMSIILSQMSTLMIESQSHEISVQNKIQQLTNQISLLQNHIQTNTAI